MRLCESFIKRNGIIFLLMNTRTQTHFRMHLCVFLWTTIKIYVWWVMTTRLSTHGAELRWTISFNLKHCIRNAKLYTLHKTTAQPLQLSRRLMRLFLPMFIRSIRNFGRRLRMATPCNLWRLVQTDRNLAGFARAFSNTWQMEALFEIALCYIALTHNPVWWKKNFWRIAFLIQ